jgi:hypothetical protein
MAAANSVSADRPQNESGSAATAPRELPEAARRALAEAEARRARSAATPPREFSGRGGLDPARYGDWEIKGIAADF